jgi:hypothetical protein
MLRRMIARRGLKRLLVRCINTAAPHRREQVLRREQLFGSHSVMESSSGWCRRSPVRLRGHQCVSRKTTWLTTPQMTFLFIAQMRDGVSRISPLQKKSSIRSGERNPGELVDAR